MIKKLILSTLVASTLVSPAFAGAGDLRVIIVSADGNTYTEVPITKAASTYLGFDATGKFGPLAIPAAVAASTIRAGSVALTAATTASVTFSTPVTGSYIVTVNTNGLATSGYATSKTATGFTLNLPIAVTGNVDYIATPVQ